MNSASSQGLKETKENLDRFDRFQNTLNVESLHYIQNVSGFMKSNLGNVFLGLIDPKININMCPSLSIYGVNIA
jgi:hypothetical protein